MQSGSLLLLLRLLALRYSGEPINEYGTKNVESDVDPQNTEVSPPIRILD